MPAYLSIQLLGGFCVSAGEVPLATLQSAGVQALLAYLLLHRDRPQARQQLAFLFWPDSSEEQAQSNLRTLLRRLKQALPESEQFLIARHHTLQWRAEAPYTLDVDEFERVLERAHGTQDQAVLEAAVRLYRGDLLPTCYDDWVVPERERLRQAFLHALVELIRLLESEHSYRAAVLHGQHLLQLDPVQESTYQLLMRLHAARADRASVVRTFHQCETVLRQELDAEPSAETRALFERLQQARPAVLPASVSPAATHNLPVLLTSFVGRTQEMTEAKRWLRDVRLVTLTGVGGAGKTRLALEMARDLISAYADGAWWVDFAALSDPMLVAQAAVAALGVVEQPGRALSDTLIGALKAKRLLLVLDNCEHLIQACAALAGKLLHACAGVVVLATSREALGIAGERVYPVPPLSSVRLLSEANWQTVREADAPQLFIERAQAVLPTFALTARNARHVAEICERVDGIPLAIELAAARIKVLSVEQLSARLDDRFGLLTAGDRTAPPRHQTLGALIDWSYDLLDPAERALLRALSVFAGGWTLEAAEAIFGDDVGAHGGAPLPSGAVLDVLSRLVDKSLVMAEMREEGPRYRLLETIRDYARAKLDATGETALARGRHAAHYLALAELAHSRLQGPHEPFWLDRLAQEHDNMLAALDWSLDGGDPAIGLQLATALQLYWLWRGPLSEGRHWLAHALKLNPSAPAVQRAAALEAVGWIASAQADFVSARTLLEQSLALARAIDDEPRIASSLYYLALIVSNLGEHHAARTLLEENLRLRQELGDWHGIARTLNALGERARIQGDYEQAKPLIQESLSLTRERGDRHRTAMLLANLGFVALHQAEHHQAAALFAESLELAQAVGNAVQTAISLVGAAGVLGAYGQARAAARAVSAAQAALDRVGLVLQPNERRDYDWIMASVQGTLSEQEFAAAWAEGRSLPLEQMLQEALSLMAGPSVTAEAAT